jgi:hypothetical protein
LKTKLCPENAYFKVASEGFDLYKAIPREELHQFLIGLYGQPVNYVNRKCCAKPDVDKYSRSGLTALSQVRRAVSWVWAKGVPLILWASSRRGRCTAPTPANNSRSVSEL